MTVFNPARHVATARLFGATCIVVGAALAGCASSYVDTATREVPVAQFRKPEVAKPVQMLFEFDTKGVANSRATDLLKEQVTGQVRASGLFSEVTDKPVAGGALLSITMNNVPLTDNAFGKGFVTGLTFGLAGSQVSDGYVSTAKYLTDAHPEPIVRVVRHAIHSTVGVSAAPPNAVKSPSVLEAVRTVATQSISNLLNDLSRSVEFQSP